MPPRVEDVVFGAGEDEALFNHGSTSTIQWLNDLASKRQERTPLRVSRVLVAVALIFLGVTMICGAVLIDSGSERMAASGKGGSNPSPPVRTAERVTPSFYAMSTSPETTVPEYDSYNGTFLAATGDFLVVQIAYSQGSIGNLPDISGVRDSRSLAFQKVATASPGVGSNFWEQGWVGRATLTSSTNVTVTPDWVNCAAPCVGSIIIVMSVARYRDVESVAVSASIAPYASSTSQTVSLTVTQPGSMLIELLSHGAYNTCDGDAAQPEAEQILRNCFTGTTERTELFDHLVMTDQTYTEAFAWAQLEIQRGIYLELDGKIS